MAPDDVIVVELPEQIFGEVTDAVTTGAGAEFMVIVLVEVEVEERHPEPLMKFVTV